jgi:PAS domain S-box-containing protein
MPRQNEELILELYRQGDSGPDDGDGAHGQLPQLTLALDRQVQRANSAMCQLLGYREDEIVGNSVLAIVHPEDMEGLVLRLEALAREIDLGLVRPFRLFAKDGHAVRIDAALGVAHDEAGRPGSIVATVLDATTQCGCATQSSSRRCGVGQLVSA